MASRILRGTLGVSARGGLTRFAVESLVTPTLFNTVFGSHNWEDTVLQALLGGSARPVEVLQTFESNIRFRTIARRKFLSGFPVPSAALDRIADTSSQAPTQTEVYQLFPQVEQFKVLGDEDNRRRELLGEARASDRCSQLGHWSIEDVLESFGCCIHGELTLLSTKSVHANLPRHFEFQCILRNTRVL